MSWYEDDLEAASAGPGFMWIIANCGQCKLPFMSNPDTVPSLDNVPFCRRCVDAANAGPRQANGLPPIRYPEGTYP